MKALGLFVWSIRISHGICPHDFDLASDSYDIIYSICTLGTKTGTWLVF